MAVALQLSKSEHTSAVMEKLEGKSKEKDGLKWWPSSISAQSNDVEITSYVLMALIGQSTGSYIPTVKWILDQRSRVGGFKSTHDTVVGLQALIKFTELYKDKNDTLLKVEYTAKDKQGKEVKKSSFGIDPSNRMIWQQHEVSIGNCFGKIFLY